MGDILGGLFGGGGSSSSSSSPAPASTTVVQKPSGSAALNQISGQMLGQQQAQVSQSNNMFSQFGQQLASLANQMAPPVSTNPAPTQSSTDLAAQITANSVHAAQTAPPGHQPQQQSFWQMPSAANTFR